MGSSSGPSFSWCPPGRGRQADQITAWEFEYLLNDLYDRACAAPFGIKTTETPQYRRVVAERQRGIRRDGRAGELSPVPAQGRSYAPDGIDRAPENVGAGKGVVFVSHVGEVCPSGFLPVAAGNVRETSLVRLYREHPIFRELRDPDLLTGRCGDCQYRDVCGGSRARAYALRGDYLGGLALLLRSLMVLKPRPRSGPKPRRQLDFESRCVLKLEPPWGSDAPLRRRCPHL